MFRDRMLDRLEEMLDAAIKGDFEEHDYDESRLSRLETKWKQFLGASQSSRQNLEQEKEKIHRLLSDISHQTKTPIANMKLYVDLLQESLEQQMCQRGGNWGSENVMQRESGNLSVESQQQVFSLLQEISRQTDKLEFLITSLTKMSRLENNIVTVQPQRQKILPLIDEVIRNLSVKAEKKDLIIHRDLPDDSEITACFDRKWTREALENILDNGIKYSPCHSEIILDAKEYEIYTAISICDHGIGIAEDEIPKIFERFYRSSEVQQEEGVGIGLYLAREILRKENGYIKVNSNPGEGTTFYLYLWKGIPG
ncbi:MAG: HAMP domain-containing histidine kinase [Lachnospiraceae bacterium]|nr:HAMP domain-containing histidine kinase [Lachnospiraceae bacterium]